VDLRKNESANELRQISNLFRDKDAQPAALLEPEIFEKKPKFLCSVRSRL
jgi:vancomycin permeability regulator SanA